VGHVRREHSVFEEKGAKFAGIICAVVCANLAWNGLDETTEYGDIFVFVGGDVADVMVSQVGDT
jgi:hypothetical protein